MVETLLDSVILIDHLNGIPQATDWLAGRGWETLAISAVTRAEVLAGAEPPEVVHISRLLDSFTCLSLTAEIADAAASIRRNTRLRLPDAFQAAVAQHHHLDLATRNTRDFTPNRFAFVHIPYQLA